MLKPSIIVDAVVTTLKTISALTTAMTSSTRITAFHFMYGKEASLAEAINRMLQPSIMVVWAGTMGGNFSGYQIFKHHVDIYFRTPNTAGTAPDIAYEDVFWLMMNSHVNGGSLNIRQIELIAGQLDLMETPSVHHMIDEEGQDMFVAKCIFGEIGDV